MKCKYFDSVICEFSNAMPQDCNDECIIYWKEYVIKLLDKLKRRNTQISDLKHKIRELKSVLKVYQPTIQEYKDFKRCAD